MKKIMKAVSFLFSFLRLYLAAIINKPKPPLYLLCTRSAPQPATIIWQKLRTESTPTILDICIMLTKPHKTS